MNKTVKPKQVVEKIFNFLFSFGIVSFSAAQNYTHQAAIDSVQTDGMYRIELSPQIRALAKIDMSDLRILDAKQAQVPYIIINEPIAHVFTSFIEYKIISTEIKNNRHTKLVIEKTDKQPISNISLYLSNTNIIKTCRLNGGNNLKQWYAISDDQELASLYDNTHTSIYKSIYFPPVDYRYYQIFINDSNSAPFNIIKAGYFKGDIIRGKMLSVISQNYTIVNDAKNKKTQINISFDNAQIINQLIFKIKEPKFYKRQAHVFVKRQRTYKKKVETYTENLFDFELNSERPAKFDVPEINEKEFTIEIEDLDNPPLKIEDIQFKQSAVSLITNLKKLGKYKLVMGDKNLKVPQYDLEYFKDKMALQLPVVSVKEIEKIIKPKSITANSFSFWQQKCFMWACIIVGAFIIFFFSFKLIKEMQPDK